MSGTRPRRCVANLGRALFELRRSSQCTRQVFDTPAKEFRHVFSPTDAVQSSLLGSFLGGRLSRQQEFIQFLDHGQSIERWWVTSKTMPQGFRVLGRSFHSSKPNQIPNSNKTSEAISKVAGEHAKTAGGNARAVRGGPVSWASLALLVVTGIGLILLWEQEKKRQIEVLRSEQGAVARTGPGVGKAAIGGPFKLLNQDGKVVTDRDFVGNWTLIYFGFTYCPDICPDELTKLAEAVDKIEKKAGLQVLPVFISIDPERDTVEQIREYLKEYHPRFVGLTGTVEDIRQVAREYRVYYMKTEDEGTDYLVDHSIITYLMDPEMNFVKFFGKNYDADSLADGVITEINNVLKGK
ncbi:protein SCO1 homolog 1, mitochondrial [Physcomitrium patens]|uniref:Thioredoxin domain-containing protein n=1 Tax=Physcomitrium patens TaxID=3218 RepID=A0A2K1KK30_PHYPA|nr:protein SCO1 homolog 1, mitochondrial-like [Physcomitrium patens]XP_024375096.1 protein SCO1 homolog 1, mitochondrial-like [Physcomitrium patens]PNR54138.1 hypothetical protein PHYPA_007814 [Physcomitrium patens]|eukprot:XP_024375095.1 protein SCO1 homolog 1, mitochondrial-like [Physcomitrella patens]